MFSITLSNKFEPQQSQMLDEMSCGLHTIFFSGGRICKIQISPFISTKYYIIPLRKDGNLTPQYV